MSYNPRQFVDREPQLDAFQASLLAPDKNHVLLFHGPWGMGKTTLLYQLRAVCREAQAACVLVDFQHDAVNTPEALIHHLCRQVGGEVFDAFGKELAALQQEFPEQASQQHRFLAWAGGSLPPVSWAQPAAPQTAVSVEAQVGNVGADGMVAIGQQIVMNKITINNAQIYAVPEEVGGYILEKRLERLNQALLGALERLVLKDKLALLFDACDSATPDVIDWLREQLLGPLLDSIRPSLTNLVIVLVGDPRSEQGAWLDEMIAWGQGLTTSQLGNLPPEAVLKYWIEVRRLGQVKIPPGFSTRGAPPYLMVEMANYCAEE